MSLETVVAELKKAASGLSNLPGNHSEVLRWAAATVSEHSKVADSWEEETQPILDYLDQELERFPKGSAWWSPPHNLTINMALGGWNFWRFTILPGFPKRRGYREDLNGIVIRPAWTSAVGVSDYSHLDMDQLQKVVTHMKGMTTVQETVRREVKWLENQFGIKVPSSIVGNLSKDALKTAKRRWSVNQLRVKDRLVPLDGSKPRDLGSFD